MRSILKEKLVAAGADIIAEAGNAVEALVTVEISNPDLIVLHLNLKGRSDGFEVAQLIQAKFNKPIVFISSTCDELTREKINSLSSAAMLSNPINDSDLRHAIIKVLTPSQN